MEAPVAIGRPPAPELGQPVISRFVLLTEPGVELQVAVLDAVEQGLGQGHGHAIGRVFVEQAELSRRLAEPSQRGRDRHGVIRQAEAELDLDLVAGETLG